MLDAKSGQSYGKVGGPDERHDMETSPINNFGLIEKFGCKAIDGEVIKRFERVTGMKAHAWLRRGLFFSHQELDKTLDRFEAGKPIYLYTGRGPSSTNMHLGHLVPFMFTKYLQEAFGAIVVIQLSDDEKFYFKGKKATDFDQFHEYAKSNAKDIIACGFNPQKTFMFYNSNHNNPALQMNVMKILQSVNGNTIRGIYGLDLSANLGQLVWPAMQCAPAYSSSFPFIFDEEVVPCLVPMAIDQAPYFRLARDVANKLGEPKPQTLHGKFLIGISGPQDKMSSSGPNTRTTIYLSLTKKEITKIINKFAFSGGGETKEEHEARGGDLLVDVAYQWLLFLEENDEKMAEIARKYRSGELMSGQIKKILIDKVWNVVQAHQIRREQLKKDEVEYFFSQEREFDLSLPQRPPLPIGEINYSGLGINFDISFGNKHRAQVDHEASKLEPLVEKRVLASECYFFNRWRKLAKQIDSSDRPVTGPVTGPVTRAETGPGTNSLFNRGHHFRK